MKKILVCMLAVSTFLFAWTTVGCKKGGNDSSPQTSIDSSQSVDDSQMVDSSQDGDSVSSDSSFALGSNELPPIEIP